MNHKVTQRNSCRTSGATTGKQARAAACSLVDRRRPSLCIGKQHRCFRSLLLPAMCTRRPIRTCQGSRRNPAHSRPG